MSRSLIVLVPLSLVVAACSNRTPAASDAAPPAAAASSAAVAQPPQQRLFEIPPDEMPTQFDQSSGQPVLREALAMIRVPEARSTFKVSGAGVTCAVLDTGLKTTHVDFRGRVAAQRNWTADNGGSTSNASDGQGHGTNVAGIIAASDAAPKPGAPRGEHTGVAPGAKVVALKVLSNQGRGDFAWVQSALEWTLQNEKALGITVLNLSLGDGKNYTTGPDPANDKIADLIGQLRQKRIPVVVAAGNDYFAATSQGKSQGQGMAYPAIIPTSTSVGAVYDANIGGVAYKSGAEAFSTAKDRLTPFSQRLHESASSTLRTDIFAPGAAITSSGINNDRGESVQQGTSQAAPMISGVILLLQEYHKRVKNELPTVDNLEKWLRAGAVFVTDDCNKCDNVPHTKLNFGRVDALAALNAAKKDIEP